MDKRAEAKVKLAQALGIDLSVLTKALDETGVCVDYPKVEASGYKGETVLVYEEETVDCSCCKGYIVKGSGEYSNYPPCDECGATKRLCYDCPGHE